MVQVILFILFLAILANESVILVPAHFCRTKTSCGNEGIKIDEPFWIGDGSLGEGCNNNREFRVECARDGMPVMNISNNLYTLLSNDRYGYSPWAGGSIAVREAGINGQDCPQPQQNFSIGSSRFLKMYDSYTPKRIFYDCSTPPPNIQVEEIRCLEKHHNNSTKHSYVFWAGQIPGGFDWFRYCERNVLTYVDDDNIARGLRWGFTLDWKTPVNCTDCELSGGRCSSNDTIGIVTCYCPGHQLPFIDETCSQGAYNSLRDNMVFIGIIAALIIAF